MSETDTKQLFDDWDNGAATSTIKANAYTYTLDVLERLGWLTVANHTALTAQVVLVAFPTNVQRLFAAFYGDTELSRESRETLRAMGPQWQDTLGEPFAYTLDDEGDRILRLYPRPTFATPSLSYPNNEPFGRDYPLTALTTIGSERDDPPEWLDAIAALLMITYARSIESASQDLDAASATEALAQLLTQIIAHA